MTNYRIAKEYARQKPRVPQPTIHLPDNVSPEVMYGLIQLYLQNDCNHRHFSTAYKKVPQWTSEPNVCTPYGVDSSLLTSHHHPSLMDAGPIASPTNFFLSHYIASPATVSPHSSGSCAGYQTWHGSYLTSFPAKMWHRIHPAPSIHRKHSLFLMTGEGTYFL